jgi:hypothetical protein
LAGLEAYKLFMETGERDLGGFDDEAMDEDGDAGATAEEEVDNLKEAFRARFNRSPTLSEAELAPEDFSDYEADLEEDEEDDDEACDDEADGDKGHAEEAGAAQEEVAAQEEAAQEEAAQEAAAQAAGVHDVRTARGAGTAEAVEMPTEAAAAEAHEAEEAAAAEAEAVMSASAQKKAADKLAEAKLVAAGDVLTVAWTARKCMGCRVVCVTTSDETTVEVRVSWDNGDEDNAIVRLAGPSQARVWSKPAKVLCLALRLGKAEQHALLRGPRVAPSRCLRSSASFKLVGRPER